MATKNPAASAANTAADINTNDAPTDGAKTPPAPPAPAAAKVKARVLVDGAYGKANDVVDVDQAEADASGELDAHPAAVKYAESLAPATPEGE